MSQLIFNPFTNRLDFVDQTIVPPGTVASITGDQGGPISPSAGTINIQGNQVGHLGAIDFAGTNPGQIYASVIVDGSTIDINSTGELSVLGSGQPFLDAATSVTAASNTGYFCNSGITVTLPASPAQGDCVTVIAAQGVFTVKANTGQFMKVANALSSSGGTCDNTLAGDSMTFRYQVTSTTWFASSFIGSWTVS